MELQLDCFSSPPNHLMEQDWWRWSCKANQEHGNPSNVCWRPLTRKTFQINDLLSEYFSWLVHRNWKIYLPGEVIWLNNWILMSLEWPLGPGPSSPYIYQQVTNVILLVLNERQNRSSIIAQSCLGSDILLMLTTPGPEWGWGELCNQVSVLFNWNLTEH